MEGKDFFANNGGKNMFDMGRIGLNISRLRKDAGLTQMGLADRLGISFQAVSNWERGISMPDIAKLGELSELLNVSIDEILGNERAAKLAESVLMEQPVPDIGIEEVKAAAPLLREEQADKLMEQTQEDNLDITELASMAPFLSQGFIDNCAQKLNPEEFMAIVPFVSRSITDQRAIQLFEQSGDLISIAGFAPFVSRGVVDDLAEKALSKSGDLSSILPVIPFMSRSKVDALAVQIYRLNGAEAIACVAPFASRGILNDIAREILKNDGFPGLSPIWPFIDSGVMEEYIISKENPAET